VLQIARDTFGAAAGGSGSSSSGSSAVLSSPHAGEQQRQAAASQLRLSAKVSGIHWMYRTPSHAAELTAGYYNTNGIIAPYRRLVQLFSKHSTTLDFTCMEMTDVAQSIANPAAFSAPHELVQQVLMHCMLHRLAIGHSFPY
jgi:formate dehydrogenase assembly factor FdhD